MDAVEGGYDCPTVFVNSSKDVEMKLRTKIYQLKLD